MIALPLEPSAEAQQATEAALGLRYHYVKNAIYENQMNIMEARGVVDAVAAHITERPESSLGVVTLNVKQRDLIAEMLEERLKSVLDADKFQEHWKQHGHELFVKNLENVHTLHHPIQLIVVNHIRVFVEQLPNFVGRGQSLIIDFDGLRAMVTAASAASAAKRLGKTLSNFGKPLRRI